ncbi:MAG: hypothetical protein KDN19_01875 [Verrucomicrobiae bacterium]|nr:hypothetical protein [Verrucomicrobiae bacterium]
MNLDEKLRAFNSAAENMRYPWWYRPSRLLLFASLPAVIIFSYSDPRMTLSRAQLFFAERDMWVGIFGVIFVALGALIGESRWLANFFDKRPGSGMIPSSANQHSRLAAALLSPRIDWILMAIFLVAHVIFFRNFFLHPGLVSGVLGGNLELKHTFKTIPGVTTWTQVSLLLGVLRGLRWSGVLPGKVKLISVFHLVFFGTLFVRAVLWSERLALIEGFVPFFIGALPRLFTTGGPKIRMLIRFLPILVPVLLLFVFTAFESLRSWQAYSGEHSSVLEFGWRRLYSYYFEAMNTGSATLGLSGFFDGLTTPMSLKQYNVIYEGLYQGALDKEYNNPSGIWFIATLSGNLLFAPTFMLLGCWHGITWRRFVQGRFFGLFFPITFLGLMEIIRIPYWFGLTRVLPSSLFIVGLIIWAVTVKRRVRPRVSRTVSACSAPSLPPISAPVGYPQSWQSR